MSSFSPSTVSRKVSPDRARLDVASLVLHLALRQQVELEHLLDRLEIEIRAHVHDREIFLVEVADRVRLLDVAGDAVVEKVDEGFRVPLGVHAHEGAELEEARDRPAARRPRTCPARCRSCSSRNHSIGFSCASSLTLVGAMRASIGPAIKRQARGLDVGVVLRHHRGRGERRDRRLADRHDMAVLADEGGRSRSGAGCSLRAQNRLLPSLTLRGLIQSVMKT